MLLDIKAQVPDRQQNRNVAVAAAIIQILDSLRLKWPEVGFDKDKELSAYKTGFPSITPLVVACL